MGLKKYAERFAINKYAVWEKKFRLERRERGSRVWTRLYTQQQGARQQPNHHGKSPSARSQQSARTKQAQSLHQNRFGKSPTPA